MGLIRPRKTTRTCRVGNVPIGGDNPVVVQSMTDTDTADVTATVEQVEALARAGSELVRITVNTREAAAGVDEIRKRLCDRGVDVPLVGDFHFNGHQLLRETSALLGLQGPLVAGDGEFVLSLASEAVLFCTAVPTGAHVHVVIDVP